MVAIIKRIMLTFAAVGLLLPALASQSPQVQAIKAFKRARGEPAGPVRLRSVERLARLKLEGNVPLFLAAMERNARSVAKSERKLQRLERRHTELHRLLTEQDNPPAKLERLTREKEETRGDLHFHQLQIREIDVENAALRAGIADAVKAQQQEARQQLIEKLIGALKGSGGYPLRGQMIKLAGSIADPAVITVLGEMLGRSRNPRERADLADALGSSGLTQAEPALIGALDDKYDVVRMTVVRGLAAVGGANAVTALIEAIPGEKGRLLEDVILALRHLTGVSFHTNVHLWRDWWKNSKQRYRRPGRHGKVVRKGLDVRDKARKGPRREGFYGIRTNSHALVFLIDKSGSMNEPASVSGATHSGRRGETKLDRAKRELIKVVRGLSTGVSINLIAYGDDLEPFAGNMVKLTNARRLAVIAWVKSLRAKGRTNIYDALAMVLDEARGKGQRITKEMVVDTVFLLTDGMPTAGKITDADALAAEVERQNAVTRIVIHTIGVGRDHARGLLERLSRASQGLYIAAR